MSILVPMLVMKYVELVLMVMRIGPRYQVMTIVPAWRYWWYCIAPSQQEDCVYLAYPDEEEENGTAMLTDLRIVVMRASKEQSTSSRSTQAASRAMRCKNSLTPKP